MAPPIFTISTARRKLFDLFETVTAHRGRNARPASDFKLMGSGKIAEGVTDPLADIRAGQQALSEKKLASLGK
jgi:hypothetical protein